MSGAKNSEYIQALGLFVVSSVGMMLINKLAIQTLPLPSTLMLIQLAGTVLLLFVTGHVNVKRDGFIKPSIAKDWAPIAVLFATMIYTSANSFLYASVSSILVFRNVTAIMSTVIDFLTRGIKVNAEIVVAEFVIVAGAVLYGGNSATFTWVGLFWMLLNGLAQVAYGVLLKHQIDVNPSIKAMQKYQMSLYNNVMAAPLILALFYLQGEHAVVFPQWFGPGAWAESKLVSVSPQGWCVILLSCFFGFLISTAGFGLQRLVSATTFIVVNNLAKFANITLGMLFLNERISGTMEWGGCLLAFSGGFWYSMATQRFQDSQKKKAVENEQKKK